MSAAASQPDPVGAVVPVGGETVVRALESALTGGGSAASLDSGRLRADGPVDVAVLKRGQAVIVPLAWTPAGRAHGDADDLAAQSDELWTAIGSSCRYRAGNQIGIALPPAADSGEPTAFAEELARTGVRRADWWRFGDTAVVLAVYGDPVPAPDTAMALHVVPMAWVWNERGRLPLREMPPTDLSWSWADVVESAG